MKITHITSVHTRYDVRIFHKECKSLAAAGNMVNLVVADGKGDEIRDGVHIIDAGERIANRIKRILFSPNRVFDKATSTNAEIYHLHDPELLRLTPRLLKLGQVIYDAHEDLPRQILGKYWIPKPIRGIVSFFSEKVENSYAGKVSGLIGATPFIADRFRKINNNVVNINNYPLLEEFTDIERKPSNERFACYIGGISIERGILEMVKAMEFVDGKLILAGNFSNPAEREKTKKLPGWEKVIEMGFCNREKVRDILASAKVGLVLFHPSPNHTDAQPNKLFEYMASGLPVIASDFSLWKKIIDSTKCGVCVDPLDVKEIVRKIKYFLESSDASEKIGLKGKKAVYEKYNWELEQGKLRSFYFYLFSREKK